MVTAVHSLWTCLDSATFMTEIESALRIYYFYTVCCTVVATVYNIEKYYQFHMKFIL